MDTSWRRNYLRYKSFFLNTLTQYRERSDWKAYLEILLSLVTISVFSIFALKPTIITIAELIQQIESKKETVAKMDSKIQNLTRAQNLYDRQRSNILLLTEISVPNSPNPDIFARQIEALSAKYQFKVANFTLGTSPVLGKDNEMPLQSEADPDSKTGSGEKQSFNIVTAIGIDQYQQITDFVKDFENLRIPPNISRLDLESKSSEPGKERAITLTIGGDLPYLSK